MKKNIHFRFVFSIMFGRCVTKLGPGSVEIDLGMIVPSNLVVSNLELIDYNTRSWPRLVPEIWTKTTKI